MKSMTKTNSVVKMFGLILLSLAVVMPAVAQEAQVIEIKSRPLQRVGNVFESVWLIDNQTVLVPLKGTLEFDILHRFGTINNGYDDFYGLYAPSNIRLGFSYVPINNLQVGFGFTKERLLWDVFAKYAILNQMGEKSFPVSVSYFVNASIDTRDKENFTNDTDRLSYFHQLMVARKITNNLSVQAAVSLSHFNSVEAYVNSRFEVESKMKNDHIAVSVSGRYKLSDALAFIANYDQPITQHTSNNPHPNVSFGWEIATPLHAFQIFAGNYKWIVPQYGNVFNQNDFQEWEFLIGFNITRLLDTQEESLTGMIFKRKNKKE